MINSNDGRRTSDLILEAGTVLRLFFYRDKNPIA